MEYDMRQNSFDKMTLIMELMGFIYAALMIYQQGGYST